MPTRLDEPRAPRDPRELLAEVHRRAGRHRRRHRAVRATAVIVVLTIAVSIPLLLNRSRHETTTVQFGDPGTTVLTRVPPTPPPTLPGGAPATFVTAMDDAIAIVATDGSGVRRRFAIPPVASPPVPGGGSSTSTLALTKLQVSPDRRSAYFIYGGGYCSPDLMRLDLTSGRVEPVFDGTGGAGISSYAISPDGTMLVLARVATCAGGKGPVDLVVRDLASGNERVVFRGDRLNEPALSFSSDGRRIAFDTTVATVADTVVKIVDTDTRAVRTVPLPGPCRYRLPQFVPSSDLLAVREDCRRDPVSGQPEPVDQDVRWLAEGAVGGRLVVADPATGQIQRSILDIDGDTSVQWYQFDGRGRNVLYYVVRDRRPDLHRLSLDDGVSQPVYPQPQPPATRVNGQGGGGW
jgi:hypothetical protein